ncbi:HAMP domain-containing sensor histidine kinase [Paenibacillus dokdonensis]|uniref:histidine kinase n=1 Tax=Paenibacillus dokdonensis TaxID=2567944 RepID=A0ABU6GML8_9BACL|nr:HAMP domain-containing sensor histidine kinase [Paenibacillus dokdonensis]MEC0240994.1 HAMP domain-containing sensor histidine kinase [Paenibacillus dokdonensis]
MRRKELPKSRFRGSLLSRYLLIILIALLFIPVLFPVSLIGYQLVQGLVLGNVYPKPEVKNDPYRAMNLENMWHKEAKKLKGNTAEQIDARLLELNKAYPKVDMFWVDSNSLVRQPDTSRLGLPQTWDAADAIAYMKRYREASQQFSVIAFIGDNEKLNQGFMVMQVSKSVLSTTSNDLSTREYMIFFGIILFMFFLFIAVSWMFFVNMRRRLLRLQSAMTVQAGSGLPEPIVIKKTDEIGQLEDAFNGMVYQLGSSLQREREEEELRKRLIANLSHDLRTPMTVIRSHVYSLQKEQLSDKGRQLLKLTETKLSDLAGLIDNLLSYNLLTSGKYTLHPESRDVLRIVRESAAAWYPLWEKEGFEVDVDLPEEPLYWTLDVQWFRRILDNLFQNVVRHARSGHYIGIHARVEAGGLTGIVISDKGMGMEASSGDKGAGIGLAIVGFLTREMGLVMDIGSTSEGTNILIYPASGSEPGLKLKG